jgi:hypothetical protein
MKKAIQSIKLFFYKLWNIRKVLKFRGFEKKLEEAVVDKQANQVTLMREITKKIKSCYPKGRSKYIPLSLKQRNEIRAAIYNQFGQQMSKLNIDINSKLEFV